MLPADALRTLELCPRAYCIFWEHTFVLRFVCQPSLCPCRRATRLVRPTASITHFWTQRTPWSNASRASTHGCRHTTRIRSERAKRTTPRSSIPPRYRTSHSFRALYDTRCDHTRRACGRLMVLSCPGLRGATTRHASRPRARADASHVAGPEGGPHAAAMQGRHRVG